MPKEMDIVKLNTIKRYIKEIKKMRVSNTSANELRIRVNSILKKIIKEGVASAKEDKRATIMPRDMTPAIEEVLGKKKLSADETMAAVKKLNVLELSALSKLITKHIALKKKQKA